MEGVEKAGGLKWPPAGSPPAAGRPGSTQKHAARVLLGKRREEKSWARGLTVSRAAVLLKNTRVFK